MGKSLASLLHEMVSSYYDSNISMPLKEYMTIPKHLNKFNKCCKDNDINIAAEKIKQFIINLFTVDPKGDSCIPRKKPVRVEPSGYPYALNVYLKNKKQMVQPQCPHIGCEKQAYFGLPFCPHCMKQIPPFIPKRKNSVLSSTIDPILDINTLQIKPTKQKVTAMIGGVKKSFDGSDVVVKDKYVDVRYSDVEACLKQVNKYKPK